MICQAKGHAWGCGPGHIRDVNSEPEKNTGTSSRVRCVIVNYRTPWEMLESCLESVTAVPDGCAVTLVDNGSGDDVIDRARNRFSAVELIDMGGNPGFSAAVNRGLAATAEEYVLLLNTDAVLAPGALKEMIAALDSAGDGCAGVAPKMMSSAHEGIIDAVGTVMPPDGASYNRGIGQCDLGQYDRAEEVFGVCFGATLLRRKLFEPEAVGPLYENYFLYFEDSDWCLRARAQGYRFLTAPAAVVHHLHSGVTRHEAFAFKYRLIELNTLKLVVRNFDSAGRATRIVAARALRLLARTFIRRRSIAANLSTIAGFLAALPELLRERRQLRRRRIVGDRGIFAFAAGENAFFDTVGYRPDRCLESLIATYGRLARQKNSEAAGLLEQLYRLQGPQPPATVREETRRRFAGQPACVQELLEQALSG